MRLLALLGGGRRGASLPDERVLAFEGGSLLDEMVLDLVLGGRQLLLK